MQRANEKCKCKVQVQVQVQVQNVNTIASEEPTLWLRTFSFPYLPNKGLNHY